MILAEQLDDLLARAPGPATWRFPEEALELPLAQLIGAAGRHAAALESLGVAAGDRVGLALENGSDYLPTVLGLWRLGAVAVPLRPHAGASGDLADFLARIHRGCDLRLVVYDERERVAAETWAARADRSVIDRAALRARAEGAGEATPPRAALRGADIALIQHSSGSTADPKGVIVTHDMMWNQLLQLDFEFRAACGGAAMTSSGSWLPFHHDMGLFIGILFPLFAGADNVLGSPRYYMHRPKRWFALQAEHGVAWNFTTNLAMANSFKSLDQLAPGSLDLSRFHLYLAAEKVHPTVLRRSQEVLGRFGLPADHVKVGYGMAENALGATSTKSGLVKTVVVTADGEDRVRLAALGDAGAVEIVSIGEANVRTRVTLVDGAGREVPELALGEICVEGPCVTPGYYNNPTASAATVPGGILHTRDIGFRYDGEVYFFARKDDVMVIGGRNISPDDVEGCAEALDGCAAGSTVLIDVPTPSGVTELVLLVEPPKGLSDEDAVAHKHALQSAIYVQQGVLVTRVVFAARHALEKTSSGKKRRRVIRERYLREELPLRAPAPSPEPSA